MRREARSPKYIATLALVSASILISGSLLKPDKKRREQPLSETELTRLQRLAQRQSLENMADFFVQLAGDLQPYIVRLHEAGRSGVIWEPNLVVTAGNEQRLPDYETFWAPSGRAVSAEATVSCPNLPVAALQTLDESSLPPATRLPVEFARPGKWILALWRRDDQEHAFAPANFLGTQPIRCWDRSFQELVSTLPLSATMEGGGVFDLDGNLLGLIVECGDRPAVLSGDTVQDALTFGTSFDGRMSTRYGMRVANLTDAEQQYFKRESAVVIKETWVGYRADQAGLLPGDLISSLEGQPVRSVDDLEMLVLPLAREIFEVGIVRGSKAMQMRLRARPPTTADGGQDLEAGLKLMTPPSGYEIDSVVAGSRAAEAGIQPGDRLLNIDYAEPRNLADVRQALTERRGKPIHLVLERRAKRWEVVLD